METVCNLAGSRTLGIINRTLLTGCTVHSYTCWFLVNLLILLFYNEETPENDLFHKNLDRMWRLGGAQAALKVFAETDRFFSIKANFNKTQEKQICKQLHIEAKVTSWYFDTSMSIYYSYSTMQSKGNKENPNDMKHELEVRTQGMWELEVTSH